MKNKKNSRIAALVVVMLSSACASLPPEEPLDPAWQAFVAQPAIPDDQNIAIGLAGLDAPRGTDFMAFGRKAHAKFFDSALIDFAAAIRPPPDRLDFVGREENIECWLDDEAPVGNYRECVKAARVHALFAENEEIFRRYATIRKLTRYAGHMEGPSLISLNRLICAANTVDVQAGKGELAYQRWRENHEFLQRIAKVDANWVPTAIHLVVHGLSFNSLEIILHHDPGIIDRHYDELQALIAPMPLGGYDPNAIMRAELRMLDKLIDRSDLQQWISPNLFRNRLLRYANEAIAIASTPAKQIMDRSKALNIKFQSDANWQSLVARIPQSAVGARELAEGLPFSFELARSMRDKEARLRLLTLRLYAAKNRVADNDMPVFLQQSGSALLNPYTNQPMRWDAAKRVIYYEDIPNGFRGEARL
jgi:hypothetical protein